MVNFRKGLINEVEIKPLSNITRLAKKKKEKKVVYSCQMQYILARARWRSPQTRTSSRTSQFTKPQRITGFILFPFLRDQ